MLSLKVQKGEWVTIGGARIKMDRTCQLEVDAPREIVVVRGSLAQNRLKREVFEVLDESGSNRNAPEEYKRALAYLCAQFGMFNKSVELGFTSFPVFFDNDPAVVELSSKLKLPNGKGAA
jgi:hypothetical protein